MSTERSPVVSIADVSRDAEIRVCELMTACQCQRVAAYRLPGRPSGWLILRSDLLRFLTTIGAEETTAAKLAA